MSENIPVTSFYNEVNNVLRKKIKDIAKEVINLKNKHSETVTLQNEDRGEVLANLTLCYRHLEDASMRLGKVLQAYDGGVSVYDKETTVGVN